MTDRIEQQDLRARRSEARQRQTFSLFLKDLCERSGLPRERAEKSLVSVLCALEQRLIKGEAEDLNAQLPRMLQDAIETCVPQRERPLWKFGRDEFLQMLSEDLGTDRAEAEQVARHVFATIRNHITEGEAEQVGHELPEDLRSLWARPS